MSVLAIVAVPLVLAALLAALTVWGSRRRGGGWVRAVAAGAAFPLTWVAWYVEDSPPRWWRRARASHGGA